MRAGRLHAAVQLLADRARSRRRSSGIKARIARYVLLNFPPAAVWTLHPQARPERGAGPSLGLRRAGTRR